MIKIDMIKWFGKSATMIKKLGFNDIFLHPTSNRMMAWIFKNDYYQVHFHDGSYDRTKSKVFVYKGLSLPLDISQSVFRSKGLNALENALIYVKEHQ